MSTTTAEDMPDMKQMSKINPLIPDPDKLQERVIPAEDIAGWVVPFEIVFGMTHWADWGLYILLAFVGTLLFGFVIPAQARYSLLARAEFLKEKTQLGLLSWWEQCELIMFEPMLEPDFKKDREGKLLLDEEEEPILDELDLEEYTSLLELDERVVEHEDGILTEVHTVDSRYIAKIFAMMYKNRNATDKSFKRDKVGWTVNIFSRAGTSLWSTLKRYAPVIGKKTKKGSKNMKKRAKGLKSAIRYGGGAFLKWSLAHRSRLVASIALGVMLVLFSKWILIALRYILLIFGW